jgi:hypothetical protein
MDFRQFHDARGAAAVQAVCRPASRSGLLRPRQPFVAVPRLQRVVHPDAAGGGGRRNRESAGADHTGVRRLGWLGESNHSASPRPPTAPPVIGSTTRE